MESREICDDDTPVSDAEQVLPFEAFDRVVGALPSQARQLPQIFLRDVEVCRSSWIEDRVAQTDDGASKASNRVCHAVRLDHAHHFQDPLAELTDQEAAEVRAFSQQE